MKSFLIVLLLATTMLAQDRIAPSPLNVIKINPAYSRWPDGSPRTLRIEVQNVSDREATIAKFELVFSDLLGAVTKVDETEPVIVHESGHRTLKPGKKGANYFNATLDPNQKLTVRVLVVKFADGEQWEAAR